MAGTAAAAIVAAAAEEEDTVVVAAAAEAITRLVGGRGRAPLAAIASGEG